MRIFFSCLLSLGIHLLLLLSSILLLHKPERPPRPPLQSALRATLQAKTTQAPSTASPVPYAPARKFDTLANAKTPPTKTTQPPSQHPSPRLARTKKLQGIALQHAQTALSKHLFYPAAAIAQGLEGDVVLLLTLDSAGQMQSVDIAKSSGHALLDEAAMDAAQHIDALPGNTRQTLLPVSFRLQ